MLHIGTSGYSYKDWVGTFYPESIKQGEMLTVYSQSFSFTEINSTYYKLPNAYMFYNMQKKTGEDFMFTVKLHGSMTHTRDASDKAYDDFSEAVNVLSEVNKLGCIMAQFPYSFHKTNDNISYIQRLKERFYEQELVVEFRNNKWIAEDTFDILRKNNIGYICVDEPSISGLMDRKAISTGKTSYIRFHGRNSDKWYNHNEAYERYDYLYKEDELKEWVDKVKRLEQDTDNCFISFNNHFRAQAVLNGMMLKKLLEV